MIGADLQESMSLLCLIPKNDLQVKSEAATEIGRKDRTMSYAFWPLLDYQSLWAGIGYQSATSFKHWVDKLA